MSRPFRGRLACLCLILICGCGVTGSRRDPAQGQARNGRSKEADRQLASGPSMRDSPLADPSTMIPPPPNMNLLEIPDPPGPDRSLVSTPTARQDEDPKVVLASGVSMPRGAASGPLEKARAVADEPAAEESNLQAVRRIHDRARERFAKLDGFECRLTRRETVGTRAMPEEVLAYKFRKEPYSVHIKWVGKEAQGRELVYSQGRYDNKVQILTGREPELLRPAGIKVSRAPTDRDLTSKSRFDIREAGMGLSILWFGKVVSVMEGDPSQAHRLRYMGPKSRIERASGLEAVDEIIPPGWEPLLPRGGRRTTFFDGDPASPSHGLPILVVTHADNGREVEYYFFDQFRPVRFTDADFDIEKLWKR